MTHASMTCEEFLAQLPEYLEGHTLPAARRTAAEAHVAACAACRSLLTDVRAIVRHAAELPALLPSRDLWTGIESRIEAPVVALPARFPVAGDVPVPASPIAAGRPGHLRPAVLPWRRLAIAASLLVAATAGVTYSIVTRNRVANVAEHRDSSTVEAIAPAATVQLAGMQSAEQTFDHEIAAMRLVVDERRKELDPATVSVLEKNLKLIDAAIAESKAALAKDPASAFLMDRVTHAYDTKLQLLRGVAALPSHG